MPTVSQLSALLGQNSTHHCEIKRLASFEKWQGDHPVFPIKLAKEGFVYHGQGDEVECHFCHFTKRDWRHGENPKEAHRSACPSCPLYSSSSSSSSNNNPLQGPSNVPIPEVTVRNAGLQLAESAPPRPHDADQRPTSDEDDSIDLHQQHVQQEMGVNFRPGLPREGVADSQYPDYGSLGKRLTSYNWDGFPVARVCPLRLSGLGFFSAGVGDLVICYHCGLMLQDWQAPDDPATAHARHRPACRHLQGVTGSRFVIMTQRELAVVGHAH
ncbi:baculoviral IAP repeat-containing protein 3-like [Littorina saxatilis]|uniref:Uncharacterized protein n=1 Tax=Littorina saxatilis TaxID=31220 RepID=A0AAN9BKU5_9CAEN